MEQKNHATIARFINTILLTLWPNGNGEEVLLLVTDAAAYIIKAGDHLKIFYPNMLHLTCLIHGLNRVTEQIRFHFQSVNKLISSIKKSIFKSSTTCWKLPRKNGTIISWISYNKMRNMVASSIVLFKISRWNQRGLYFFFYYY